MRNYLLIMLQLAGFCLFSLTDTFAEADNSPRMFIGEDGKPHVYTINHITGKPRRVYPDLDVTPYLQEDKGINYDNANSIARDILRSQQEFLGIRVDDLELRLSKPTKLGMWVLTYQQMYRDVPVYGGTIGLTIGRHNTVRIMGGTFYDDINVSTYPAISSTEAASSALRNDSQFSGVPITDQLIEKAELVIYPQINENQIETQASITYHLAWVIDAVSDSLSMDKRYIVDATDNTVFEQYDTAVPTATRTGNVQAQVYTGHAWESKGSRDLRDLHVVVYDLSFNPYGSDDTDTNGDYSISWGGVPGNYLLRARLEGPYMEHVKDEADGAGEIVKSEYTDVPPSSATIDWTPDSNSESEEELNVFYYVNEAAHWFSDYVTIDFKVKPKVRDQISGDPIAECSPDQTNELRFDDDHNGARESDVIYHEYFHAVHYHMFDGFNWSGVSQAGAIGEGMPDYFACSINNDEYAESGDQGTNIDIDPYDYKNWPDDYTSGGDYNLNYTNGLIVNGAAWHLRGYIGQDTTDTIIIAGMEMSPQADTFEEFFDYTLLADDDIYGNGYWNWPGCGYGWGDKSPHAEEIWDSFGAIHTMPSSLLSEDPDCSPKLVVESETVASERKGGVLEATYPNPFNAETTIELYINVASIVKATVYDIGGQKVRSLIDGRNLESGRYKLVWDGRSDGGVKVGSGVYLLNVRVGEERAVAKLVMVQ